MSRDLVQLGDGGKPSRLGETPRLILTLTAAGLLSGLAIVGAYELTLPRIRANQAAALKRAVFEVLPGADSMQRLVWRGGALQPAGEEAGDDPSIYAGYAAHAAGARFVGYAIPAAGAGFQDTIRLIFGFAPDRRRIVGMQVLESRETPGLGDKIYKDADFVAAFRDLAVDPKVELVKEEPTAPNQVDAITGATISSAAVVKIVNAAGSEWLGRLPSPGQAPPAPEDGAPVSPGPEPGGPVPGGKLGG